MEWSSEQQRALKAVNAWIKDPKAPLVFKLFGYAGTGKTTLAKHLAEGVKGRVLFGAYTGKAAHVLQSKGCEGARTIHSLIYITSEKSKKRLKELEKELAELYAEQHIDHEKIKKKQKEIDSEKKKINQPAFSLNTDSEVKDAKLLVIDECSMIGNRMGEHLVSFNTKILVLGDPFQLPPVGDGGYFTNGDPDFMLTDVQRQARDNPVLWLATQIREDLTIKCGQYGSSIVTSQRLPPEKVVEHNQMLVGKNKTRISANSRWREVLGLPSGLPVEEDKVVCLRNNHELGLLNGSLWKIKNIDPFHDDDRIVVDLASEDTSLSLSEVIVATQAFENKPMPSWWELEGAEQFDYGYCLTTHKAQGSQWKNVLIYNEGYVFKEVRWRWLYTAVTRASEQVSVVL